MSARMKYNYAYLNTSGKCYQVLSCDSAQPDNVRLIPIPECDAAFIGKYYINGGWYTRTVEYDESGNEIAGTEKYTEWVYNG